MPRALLRLAQIVLVFAVFCMANGSDFVAQGLAWGTMIIDYSSHETVVEAVIDTFDGSHSCTICKRVDEQQGSQTKRISEARLRKLDLCFEAEEHYDLGQLGSVSFSSPSRRRPSGWPASRRFSRHGWPETSCPFSRACPYLKGGLICACAALRELVGVF